MSAARTPIPGHPGFYRERDLVYFRVRNRRGRRRWLTARTVKEAERKKVAAEIAIERGEFRERSRDTFASYAASWVETYSGRPVAGSASRPGRTTGVRSTGTLSRSSARCGSTRSSRRT
jgi:hypothetical protein